MTRDQRRLAAIVSADVAGYSRLMGRDESDTLSRLKAHLRELFDPKIAEYDGRIVKTTGDGLLLEFPSVVEAVRCAVDVQRGMAERNAGVPADQRIEFRIGINVGDIIIDGDDIYGDGVNVAARLQALSEPGGICVSRAVRDQVLDKLSFTFEDLGAQQVKNIVRPVEVFRVHLGSGALPTPSPARRQWLRLRRAFGWRWLAAGAFTLGLAAVAVWKLSPLWKTAPVPAPPAMSAAIAPLIVSHADAGASRFAETLVRDLASRLGRVGGPDGRVHVDAVQSDPARRNDGIDPRQLGRSVNVRYVLDGSVLRGGDGNTVNLRLVDAVTGRQVWSERETLQDSDVSAESSVPLRSLSRRVRTALVGAEKRRVMAQPLSALSATELVLRAAASRDKDQSLAGTLEARQLVDEALRLDPSLVPALITWANLTDDEYGLDPKAERSRIAREMNEYTGRAVELDPTDPWAWAWRSIALTYLERWDAALEANDMAIKLDPDESRFYNYRGYLMNALGRPAEGLALVNRALAMDPTDAGEPMLGACHAYLLLGQAAQAVATCEKATALSNWWFPKVLLVAAYADHGEAKKAAAAKAEVLLTIPGYTIAQARAYDQPSHPEYTKLAEKYYYEGLRRAGLPEN